MNNDFIVLEGKNLDSLVQEAMKKLGARKEQLEVQVLESKKSLFNSYYKIKVSTKNIKTFDGFDAIEKSLNDICNDSLANQTIEKQNDVEFIYNNEGVFVKLTNILPINEIKMKIELKKVSSVSFEELEAALRSGNIQKPIKISSTQEEAKTDSRCTIRITEDKLQAFLYVISPNGGKHITEEIIYKFLSENNIKFGIKDNEIRSIVNNKLYDMEMKIAEGIWSIPGIDAKFEYHFDVNNDTKLIENDGGKIDFRELSLIKNVKVGQVLVTMTPPADGVLGRNVFNEEVKAKEGKKLMLPKGKNVVISKDGLQLISSIDGEVKIIDNKVHVFSIYMVPANVDNSTGNIRFIGKVVVQGNVLTGFSIEAEGDVEVFGVVEGAKIISKGNIILHRGIQGMNKGELYCDGDLVAKFIENSIIEAKGNVHSDAIMHSNVICGKKLEAAGRKGLLVGGQFKVADEIRAKVIGSPMATITELEVGVNPDLRKNYEILKLENKSILENIEKVTKATDLLTKISQKSELPPEKRELLTKSIQAKMQLMEKLEVVNKKIKEVEGYLEDVSKGKIKVYDVIYPGARITIGSSMYYVKDPLKYLTIYRANADIKIGPFEN